MKKHIIIIMNVVLILAVLGLGGFIVYKSVSAKPEEPVVSTVETLAPATVDEPTAEPVKLYKVGIVQNGLGSASKDCYEGFITELNERGVLSKLDIVYIVEDDKELCREKIQTLVNEGCDLLYTIGRYATEASAEITKDVPIIFGAVNSPDEIGLVESNEVPGGNVTGVSSFPPCFEQIDLIKLLMPEVKSVAAVYSATDADAVSQGIVAAGEAENIGLTCDKYTIESEAALKSTLAKIKEAKTEVIYIPVDMFLSGHIDMIAEFSYENKIPVICGDESTLMRGALATSVTNYSSIGHVAASMADDVLFNGKSTATLRVVYKHDCNNLVNKEVADKLGIKIPTTAMSEIKLIEPATEEPAKPAETAAETTEAASESE